MARKKNKKNTSYRIKIVAPSGKCPVLLDGTDEESVKIWMSQVQAKQPPGYELLPSAFRYWVSHTYDIFSQECKQVRSIIDKLTQPK